MSASAEAAAIGGTDEPDVGTASPYLEAAAVGMRVAGMVVALAYLTGWIDGPLLAAAGGLALVTFGHALALERDNATLSGAAFAIVVLALVAGALRWVTLELPELRGVQAVLGPTLVVERTGSAQPWLLPAAAWTAASAAVIAMALWLPFPRGHAWFSLLPWAGELIVGGSAIATVFWGPAGSGEDADLWTDLGRWALVTICFAIPAAGFSYLFARLGRLWSFVGLGIAASAALTAAGVVAGQVLT